MKYVLLFLSFSLFAQRPAVIFPVYDQPKAKRISIIQVVIHIRELKTKSFIKYGEAVDFYYKKIASTGKNQWIEKLEEFSLDPDCPANSRAKINEQIHHIRMLQIGEKVPEIRLKDFLLSQYFSEKPTILLVFYSPSCFHCTELLVDLIPYSEKIKLPVIAIQIDEEMNPWTFPTHWKTIKANEKLRKEYGVFSTPSLFLIQRNSLRISAIPENMTEIKEFEHLF
ncbi:TlpA family protein disulfide reductase [Aquirufa lenticrescens]|uniref:TlpA family protein disulfide reductase n=1 Tax=Aquirufa lenticrescens TaxID=2696560 RepID=UPI001CAA5EE4|nr:thioredoxin family protein [Aquirufa lenticrescens]UAJ14632.1 thioredoxin family protein [Aquirufa lenticrescens]